MEEKRNLVSWEGHYISEPKLFKAVSFANRLLSDGKSRKEACELAANYAKLPITDITVELMVNDYLNEEVEDYGDNSNE